MSSQAARLAAARRQRRYRARQRSGEAVLEVPVAEHDIASALVATGWLTPQQALDRRQLELAISHMLADWSAAWVMRHSC